MNDEDRAIKRRKQRGTPNTLHRRRERMKLLRQEKREQGLCIYCHREAIPDECLCEKHKEYTTARRKAKAGNGRCSYCSNNSAEGHKLCSDCLVKYRARSRATIEERKSAGLCHFCGKNPKKPGRCLCDKCLNDGKERCKTLREKRLTAGLCMNCGKSLHLPSSSRCEICFLKATSRDHFGSVGNWEVLRDKFISCNECCAYTGRKLTLGVDAQLDHIIPFARGGSLVDVTNVQWVHKVVNEMKRSLLEEEFFDWISAIYKHRIST